MVPFFVEGLASEEGLGGGAPPAYGELAWDLASFSSTLRLFGGANDVGLAVYAGLCALALVILAARTYHSLERRETDPQRDGGRRIHTSRALALLIAWMVLPLVTVLSIPTGHGVRIRYLLFLLPVYLLLVAFALDVIIRWTSSCLSNVRPSTASPASMQPPLTIAALAVLLVISIPSLASYYTETKQNWRDATWLVQASSHPEDILFVSRGHHRAGILFYAQQWADGANHLTDKKVRILPRNPTKDLLPPDHDQAWLIAPLEEEYLPGGELDSILRPSYRLLPPTIFAPSHIPKDSALLGPIMFRSLAVLQMERLKAPTITFSADDAVIADGDCTQLRWEVENVREVYLDGAGVIGHGEREVCPTATTTYELEAIALDGQTMVNRVQVEVTSR
jgi:hypothetical protein